MTTKALTIPVGWIEQRIFFIRGHKVMVGTDLARLYGVAPKTLNQAVKRNMKRFPEDFMFQLAWEEAQILFSSSLEGSSRQEPPLRSQSVTLKRGKHIKYLPYVFTEQGVAMLSTVLRSDRAILVNIEIMRAFVKLREILSTHKDLARKLDQLEKRYDTQFKAVFDAIRELMTPTLPPKRRIGFSSAGDPS